MMSQVMDNKAFIITYDSGDGKSQTLTVTHKKFNDELEFRQFITRQKCLACNFESKFVEYSEDVLS